MGGEKNERQERGFISCIKDGLLRSNGTPITVNISCTLIRNVVDAEKAVKMHVSGKEPYADVLVYDTSKFMKLSLKGTKAPSLAGGGMTGVELITPGLGARFMKMVHSYLLTKLQPGDKVPEMYGRIPDDEKIKLVLGNELIGGPIDYIYIGPMDVKSEWHADLNEVRMSGMLHNSLDFASNHVLYFRLRSRRWDQRFDPNALDKDGVPKIYGVSPSKGDSAGRLVITNKIPEQAEVLLL